MENKDISILVTDDEAGIRKMLKIALKRQKYRIFTANSGEEAIKIIKSNIIHIVITDLKMPGLSGLDLLKIIKQYNPEIEVIILTAHGSIESAITAVKEGAFDYIQKPFKIEEIKLVVIKALEQSELRKENSDLKKELEKSSGLYRMIGNGKAMQNVFNLIRKAAPSKASVLITGESGTGKELVAKALHKLSKRNSKAFLAVNCGAIPEQLLESELFGHIKGSFTGATHNNPGLFAAAQGGTLLLDEIGEMPVGLQVKLLRALQEHKVKPVGSLKEIDIDVRVIASTNRNIEEEIKKGNFRGDLYYRLNVIHIHIPPLRERREDIPPLINILLRDLANDAAIPLPKVSNEAVKFLQNYDFPGNVRELENMLERALVLDTDGILGLDDINHPSIRASASGELDALTFSLDEKLDQTEREYILEALDKTKGNRTEAARLLGITFRSLRYRMAKLNLS